jgi:hypothetical protein
MYPVVEPGGGWGGTRPPPEKMRNYLHISIKYKHTIDMCLGIKYHIRKGILVVSNMLIYMKVTSSTLIEPKLHFSLFLFYKKSYSIPCTWRPKHCFKQVIQRYFFNFYFIFMIYINTKNRLVLIFFQ